MNLDLIAAERAQEIVRSTRQLQMDSASDLDNTVTKTLGVLQEDGVYAAFLFLLSRPNQEKERAKTVRGEMLNLLEAIGFTALQSDPPNDPPAEQVLRHLTDHVTGNADDNALERLMLAKETLEQMLVYARYGAKAWKQES